MEGENLEVKEWGEGDPDVGDAGEDDLAIATATRHKQRMIKRDILKVMVPFCSLTTIQLQARSRKNFEVGQTKKN